MKHQVFQLFFKEQGGMLLPRDPHLHQLAVEFAEKELAEPINFTDYRNVWVECECDDTGKPVKVEGLSVLQTIPDIPVFRSTGQRSAKMLIDRMNDYLHDQGARGQRVLLHISETEAPEQRCPKYLEWLAAVGAKPAERWAVVVK